MANVLRNLKLSELSLVGNPANEHAKVLIAKAGDPADPITHTHDPVLKVGETIIKRSVVGSDVFESLQNQQDELEIRKYEAQATKEFPNAVGSPRQKAELLMKASTDPALKSYVDQLLRSNGRMVAKGMDRFGTSNPGPTQDGLPMESAVTKAEAMAHQRVSQVTKNGGILTFEQAYDQLLQENDELAAAVLDEVGYDDEGVETYEHGDVNPRKFIRE